MPPVCARRYGSQAEINDQSSQVVYWWETALTSQHHGQRTLEVLDLGHNGRQAGCEEAN